MPRGTVQKHATSPRNSWHCQLDWIRFWRQSIFDAAARNPRVGSFFRMRGSIVRRSRTRFSLAISINHRVSNHGRCAAGFPKERNPTRVSTTTGHPGVNHGSVQDFQITNRASWSEPRMETEASGISIQGCKSRFGSHLGISRKPQKPKWRLQIHTEPPDQLQSALWN